MRDLPPDFTRLRTGMVDGQIRVADVTDHRIIAAFLDVPREDFVPDPRRAVAYLDDRTPLGPAGRAMLDPMTLAKLLQLAAPRPGERVLVVGAGLGYTAVLLNLLDCTVVALEQDAELAADARARLAGRQEIALVEGVLTQGSVELAPYDLIFLDGAVTAGFETLGDQLAPNGRMVGPAGSGPATKATVFRLKGRTLVPAATFDAPAPILPGFGPVETFAF